jgi:hypothetical protein
MPCTQDLGISVPLLFPSLHVGIIVCDSRILLARLNSVEVGRLVCTSVHVVDGI